MKKLIILFITLISISNFSYAQDVLTKRSGDDIISKILEVTTTEVKYKKFDNLNGPTFTILKSDLLMIRYENGTKDVFNSEKKLDVSTITTKDFFQEGQNDANIYYKGYKASGTTAFLASLLITPIVGLIPAAICAGADPQDENLGYPSRDLMQNKDYSNGYKQKAKKIKQQKVWKNLLIGSGIYLVLVGSYYSGY